MPSHRPQAAQAPDRLAEERVAGEAGQELGVVVLQAEHEAHMLDARFAFGADEDRSVRRLGGLHPFEPAGNRDRHAQQSVAYLAGRVAPMAGGQSQGVRAARRETGVDGELPHPVDLAHGSRRRQ